MGHIYLILHYPHSRSKHLDLHLEIVPIYLTELYILHGVRV